MHTVFSKPTLPHILNGLKRFQLTTQQAFLCLPFLPAVCLYSRSSRSFLYQVLRKVRNLLLNRNSSCSSCCFRSSCLPLSLLTCRCGAGAMHSSTIMQAIRSLWTNGADSSGSPTCSRIRQQANILARLWSTPWQCLALVLQHLGFQWHSLSSLQKSRTDTIAQSFRLVQRCLTSFHGFLYTQLRSVYSAQTASYQASWFSRASGHKERTCSWTVRIRGSRCSSGDSGKAWAGAQSSTLRQSAALTRSSTKLQRWTVPDVSRKCGMSPFLNCSQRTAFFLC